MACDDKTEVTSDRNGEAIKSMRIAVIIK